MIINIKILYYKLHFQITGQTEMESLVAMLHTSE